MEHLNHKRNRALQKIDVFVKIVNEVSTLSTSSRLKVSCMLIKKDFTKIAAFGYNGNYYNAPVNPNTGTEEESLEPGQDGYIHAEQNVLTKFREPDPENYIVLISHSPCKMCTKLLVNSGFKYIYWVNTYRETSHLDDIFSRCKIEHGNIEKLSSDYLSGKIVSMQYDI